MVAEQARFDRDRRPDRVVAALGIGRGDAVADLGAGGGLMTVHLARAVGPTGRVVATDMGAAPSRRRPSWHELEVVAARLPS
jgi:tRNA A58 N-methylase Trm61